MTLVRVVCTVKIWKVALNNAVGYYACVHSDNPNAGHCYPGKLIGVALDKELGVTRVTIAPEVIEKFLRTELGRLGLNHVPTDDDLARIISLTPPSLRPDFVSAIDNGTPLSEASTAFLRGYVLGYHMGAQ